MHALYKKKLYQYNCVSKRRTTVPIWLHTRILRACAYITHIIYDNDVASVDLNSQIVSSKTAFPGDLLYNKFISLVISISKIITKEKFNLE